jgi:hypothetical protein
LRWACAIASEIADHIDAPRRRPLRLIAGGRAGPLLGACMTILSPQSGDAFG